MFLFRKKNIYNNYFISIGAGENQVSLIREAKKLNFRVIGVDRNMNAAGFGLCDLRIQESIDNHESILKIITELMLDGSISGALTKSYGTAVRTAAYLNMCFKRPHIPYQSAEDFLNKSLTKNILITAGIKTPKILNLTQKNLDNHNFKLNPVVIKPVDGHAKEGVRLVNDSDEYRHLITSMNGSKQNLIIEEAVTGDEIIAMGIIADRKYHLIEVTDKITSSPPYFLDLLHSAPSVYCRCKEQITAAGNKIAETFRIENSPLIMEMIVSTSKEIYLIEAVPEFGGEYLTDILIPGKTGYNPVRETIKAMAGMKFTPPPDPLNSKGGFAVRYIPAAPGIARTMPIESALKMKGVVFAKQLILPGTELSAPSTNHHRAAVIAAKGRTAEEASAISAIAEEALVPVIEN